MSYVKEIHEYAQKLIDSGSAYAFVDNGEAWACAGVCELEPHRGSAWAWIRDDIGVQKVRFLQFHRAVIAVLDDCGYQRVELVTYDGHREAERWAEMLGFRWEGCMSKYFPNGTMGNLYARIK